MTIIDWLRGQLNDPTSGMHLMGFVIMGAELYRHLHTGAAWDLNAVIAACVCWGSGGALDVAQKVMALKGAKAP